VSYSTPIRQPRRSISSRRFLRSAAGSALARSVQTTTRSIFEVCRACLRSAERVSSAIVPSAFTARHWKKQKPKLS